MQASCNPFAGLILPFIIVPVYNTLGHQWSGFYLQVFDSGLLTQYHYRIFWVLAFMSIGINILPIAFLKDQKTNKKPPKVKNFDVNVLKNLNMVIWMVAGPLTISGRLITMTFLPCEHYKKLYSNVLTIYIYNVNQPMEHMLAFQIPRWQH